ncbi:glycosyltransferase [Bradyrhizobium sp.]|uniref:glycosyltransferase n=1 Tax=Bradyrhizobium sp. TaxID=376 RepID=UPI001D793BEA|nr:glycosyltransferase [Bradyrhizobium sp.]MBI5322704.1 bifunctional glycosyltransferase family 2/GtrA family protein [Bradyrhizobium sp.]
MMGVAGTTAQVVIIPAYNPPPVFVDLVEQVLQRPHWHVVVVDDGTRVDQKPIFTALSSERVTVLTHAVNLGKGAALKTGMNYALSKFGRDITVLTLDADGQHLVKDLEAVAQTAAHHSSALILGVRDLGYHRTPLRSFVGNKFTKVVVHALVGLRVSDTQTGLRAMPGSFAEKLLHLVSNGYEFELEMLVIARHMRIQIIEQKIETVYSAGNKTSHFRPLIDSVRIYVVLLRFMTVALVSAIVDNLIFLSLLQASTDVMYAEFLARCLTVPLNFILLRKFVFYSALDLRQVLPRYLGVVAAFFCLSVIFVSIRTANGFSAVSAKLFVESLLFFANFIIQRDYVFANRRRRHGE